MRMQRSIMVSIVIGGAALSLVTSAANPAPASDANRQGTAAAAAETSTRVLLSQRLGGPIGSVLLQNHFVLETGGILVRRGVAVGELKRLFQYQDKELEPMAGMPLGHPGYYLWFPDARCSLTVEVAFKDIRDASTLVNVGVNTNPPPRREVTLECGEHPAKSAHPGKGSVAHSPGPNETPGLPLLSRRLGGTLSEILPHHQFTSAEGRIWFRSGMPVGDLKRLLRCEDEDFKQASATSPNGTQYIVWFADGRCVAEIAEAHKSIHDEATLVNVAVSTNPPSKNRNPLVQGRMP